MKGEDSPTTISIPPSIATATATTRSTVKRDNSVAGLFGNKSGYKFWVLFAILLLAFWSMFTGSVTLKWSSGNLMTSFSDDINFQFHDDLDILELEEREKVVRRMWEVYTHSSSIRLPRFWLEAFEAAYEYLASDLSGVRDAAVSEIAKLSMLSINLDPLPLRSKSNRQLRKNTKNAGKSREVTAVGTS